MKTVILAGGLGTRLSEETQVRPKPMVEIGGYPILWHIMKIYSHFGLNDFVICLGYKGYMIKEYFVNYLIHKTDITVDIMSGSIKYERSEAEPWTVTLVDTGNDTNTGGRLRRVRSYLDDDAPFCMTYGDGVADVDMRALIAFHRSHGLNATLTAVRPPGRYGSIKLGGDRVEEFTEKPAGDGGYINGGFFVLNPKALDHVDGDDMAWEWEPIRRLVAEDQLAAYQHHGYWQSMDTLRDKNTLESLWASGSAPWKLWEA